MKKWYIVAGILAVLMLAGGCLATETAPASKLEVLSHKMIKGDDGVEVRVTVKNAGSNRIELAEVTVNFYDANGTLIDTSKDAVMNLGAGENWTFTIACSGAGCEKVKTYDIKALAGTSSGIR
ncbi:FxLYD domain-containing protein [Chloroflexota bacterium]